MLALLRLLRFLHVREHKFFSLKEHGNRRVESITNFTIQYVPRKHFALSPDGQYNLFPYNIDIKLLRDLLTHKLIIL